MPDISKIKLPSGTVYDIKDATARQLIETITGSDVIIFKGVSTTKLTDGGNETPTVGGQTVTPATGNLFFYQTEEFIYGTDNKWHALGSLSNLGELATKDSATGTITPTGSVSQPTFTGSSSSVTITSETSATGNYTPAGSVSFTNTNQTATVSTASSGEATYTPAGSVAAPIISIDSAGATDTIKNPSSVTVAKTVVAAAPGVAAPDNSITYYSISDETLSLYQLGYTTGDSITTSNVTVKTGDASYTASAPAFTGTGARLVTGNISVPSSASFSGTKVQLSGTTTAAGTVSQPTFSGDTQTVTVS